MKLEQIDIAGRDALLREDLPGRGGAVMFCPAEPPHARSWLHWAPFGCPTLLFGCSGLAFACEPDEIAADLLRRLPSMTPQAPLFLFGFCAGSVIASLTADALADLDLARPIMLILANPINRWWPRPVREATAGPLVQRAMLDPDLNARLEARSTIIPPLCKAKQNGLRIAILASARSTHDMKQATPIAQAIGNSVIEVPADQHDIIPWLMLEIFGKWPPADLERSLAAQRRQREPTASPDTLQAWAKGEVAARYAFWDRFAGLKAVAESL